MLTQSSLLLFWLQGVDYDQCLPSWITSYQIGTSDNQTHWVLHPTTYVGNRDYNGIVKRNVAPLVAGKYFRFYPLEAHGKRALRLELYGCPACGKCFAKNSWLSKYFKKNWINFA